ncbi:hypothetical protein ACJIZ3_009457 [Penstemon smallii]|uniref:C2 domain-containing protein n=1 Tax=Penstemon smallii TaxID=265156 RepID=A0ABD3TDM5_9LAMI
MGKIWVEVCLISGRGLRRTSSLFKLQWFAVGWIDPDNKYCTKIDSTGNGNPVWKTKFSMAVDTSELKIQELAVHVEVYSREPVFLRQSLLGTATIVLKEFLDKYSTKSEVVPKPVEEVGSFQLRKRNSNKPQGFVDISIRVSEEREDTGSSYPGGEEGINLTDHNGGINLATGYGSLQSQRPHIKLRTSRHPENTNSSPIPPYYTHHPSTGGPNYPAAGPSTGGHKYPAVGPSAGGPNYPGGGGPSYQPPQTPTPPTPPPPSNVGYIPNFFPRNDTFRPSYINMPSSGAPTGHGGGPGFGMGLGAGALAAGAMIFGDDFMSGFEVPNGLRDANLTISTNPPS